MLDSTSNSTQLQHIVSEWATYCYLADSKRSNLTNPNKFTKRRTKLVWEEVDKSLPIPLGDDLWHIRIMHHKLKGLCVDIRRFNRIEDATSVRFEASDEGITLRIEDMIKFIDPLFKLIRKWKGK